MFDINPALITAALIFKGGTCANRHAKVACPRDAERHHIYCLACRVATGGYNRYNRNWKAHLPRRAAA
jgi:hypothetical protein